jgi:chromosomal replication initiator protein
MKTPPVISAYIIPGLKEDYSAIMQRQTIDKIIKATTRHYGETFVELLKRDRRRNKVTCRHVICFLLRKHTTLSQQAVGDIFGVDHTTVVHSVKQVKNFMRFEEVFRKDLETIESNIQ